MTVRNLNHTRRQRELYLLRRDGLWRYSWRLLKWGWILVHDGTIRLARRVGR